MTSDVSTPWYMDKSFYLVIFTALCALVATMTGIHLDAGQLAGVAVSVAGVIGMFIKASKDKQAAITVAKINADASAKAAAAPVIDTASAMKDAAK